MDRDDILDALREVRATIAEWQEADVFPGDQGYQDLLEREAELVARLGELDSDS